MNKIDTILLDIDGTLIDSEKYTISSKIIEGKKYGFDIKEEIVINTLGMSRDISENYFKSAYCRRTCNFLIMKLFVRLLILNKMNI